MSKRAGGHKSDQSTTTAPRSAHATAMTGPTKDICPEPAWRLRAPLLLVALGAELDEELDSDAARLFLGNENNTDQMH